MVQAVVVASTEKCPGSAHGPRGVLGRILRVAVLVACMGIVGCNATTSSRMAEGSYIRLANGQMWRGVDVVQDHPTLKVAMPYSSALWRAGYRSGDLHCYFLGEYGREPIPTLTGIHFAVARRPNMSDAAIEQAFGRFITPLELRTAEKNNSLVDLYAIKILEKTGGEVGPALAFLDRAMRIDIACQKAYLKRNQAVLALAKSQLLMTRRDSGEPVVIRTGAGMEGLFRQLVDASSGVSDMMSLVIQGYQLTETLILRSKAVPSNGERVAVATPQPQPKATKPARPVGQGQTGNPVKTPRPELTSPERVAPTPTSKPDPVPPAASASQVAGPAQPVAASLATTERREAASLPSRVTSAEAMDDIPAQRRRIKESSEELVRLQELNTKFEALARGCLIKAALSCS